jgi:late competence protein required for DNA uptake (superfamily II DNA/RNA helicase)
VCSGKLRIEMKRIIKVAILLRLWYCTLYSYARKLRKLLEKSTKIVGMQNANVPMWKATQHATLPNTLTHKHIFKSTDKMSRVFWMRWMNQKISKKKYCTNCKKYYCVKCICMGIVVFCVCYVNWPNEKKGQSKFHAFWA